MGGGGGGTKQDFEQSERFARISRDLWTDYQQRYVPEQKQLIATINSEESAAREAVGMATDTVNKAFGAQEGALNRDLRRFGVVTPTPEYNAASHRTMDMARTGALARLNNSVRLGVKDQDMAVMTGGMSALGRNINTAAGGM
jgi:hypothetical protein